MQKENGQHIQNAVNAIVFNPENKKILLQNSQTPASESSKWEFPFCRQEFGETAVGAIIRMMRKKGNFFVEVGRSVGDYDHMLLTLTPPQHWVIRTHVCMIRGNISFFREIESTHQWFDFLHIKEYMYSMLTDPTKNSVELLRILISQHGLQEPRFMHLL